MALQHLVHEHLQLRLPLPTLRLPVPPHHRQVQHPRLLSQDRPHLGLEQLGHVLLQVLRVQRHVPHLELLLQLLNLLLASLAPILALGLLFLQLGHGEVLLFLHRFLLVLLVLVFQVGGFLLEAGLAAELALGRIDGGFRVFLKKGGFGRIPATVQTLLLAVVLLQLVPLILLTQ
jgi:hypothetical protein